MITDTFNRIHTYLRISLTDHCNLRCSYCMPGEDQVFAPSSRLMQTHEIIQLAGIFVKAGVTKIRLTGGEPLVRKDAGDVIMGLAQLPVSLSITTNATRIHEHIEVLEKAKVRSVNISLDTLDADKFSIITKRNYFHEVIRNISLLLARGFHVKVNVVMMKGVNDMEIPDFIRWTKNEPVHVRFIEFMPFDGNRWSSRQVITWQQILQKVSEHENVIALPTDAHDTAKTYTIPGHAGTFSVISTMSAPFCGSCNRMRLTADGKMKNCLFSTHETDLLQALRSGEDVEPLIHQCILTKEAMLGGQMNVPFAELDAATLRNRSMIAIGG
ncbi:GTP 3',8-cyclase MoaA [Hufsiella ginkgonis]|uniref:GTP 3',8-cyclase n=1 Tax=Hufsiella ginkgonis TaxID=2695274 RepID=A0A7K1XZA5_9SPHI|nr:GTP 3',8-cyclase MoaA [Hufsiella ginkgonis]MXV16069.1 GTP 3',8-cyclase MoaA [Hufsiella ginkgonis]